MERRRDALVGAATIVEMVAATGRANSPGVATVGRLHVRPGSRNVIPDSVLLSVDLRHPNDVALDAMSEDLKIKIDEAAMVTGLGAEITEVLGFAPTLFDQGCIDAARESAKVCGYEYVELVSGGGHDACNVARIAPAAMVFCPCVDGISHAEAENIRPEWAEAGANVLLQAVLTKAA